MDQIYHKAVNEIKGIMATKTIHKAYKFRLKTNGAHAEQLARIAGVCRLVWYLYLEQRTLVYSSSRKFMNSYNQLPEVTQLRKAYGWIEDVPSQVLQQKGRSHDSFRFPQGFKMDNRRIFLPKIGWIGFFKSREIKGTIRHITLSRYGMHWYVSVTCEVDIPIV
jgi:putative transposase